MKDSPDYVVLEYAQMWLAQYPRVLLFTVINTWGSSPRPVGSIMVMNLAGEIAGSISGGCIEEDIIKHRKEFFSIEKPLQLEYGVSAQQAATVSLPCGGRLELVVEVLTDLSHVSAIVDSIQRGVMIYRQLDLDMGRISIRPVDGVGHDFRVKQKSLLKRFGRPWELIIIGANQITHYLAEIAEMLGYRIIVIESRREYIDSWQLSDIGLEQQYPDEALARMTISPYTAIVALTHDPQLDDRSLMEVIDSPAFYLGVLGSQRTHQLRVQRLLHYGVSAEGLSRLHAPVGLPIGSKTPSEIAVSIIAEITAVRHKVNSGLNVAVQAAVEY